MVNSIGRIMRGVGRLCCGCGAQRQPDRSQKSINIKKIVKLYGSAKKIQFPPLGTGILNRPEFEVTKGKSGRIECRAGNDWLILDKKEGTYAVYSSFTNSGYIYKFDGTLRYAGRIINGKMDGEGTLYTPSGVTEFRGTFVDGKIQGRGILYGSEFISEGEFIGDKLQKGVKRYLGPKGGTLEGEFVNDKLHGHGAVSNDNFRYEGGIVHNKMQGIGTVVYKKDGAKIEGKFFDSHFIEGGSLSDEKLALLLIGAGESVFPRYVMNCLMQHLTKYAELKRDRPAVGVFLSLMETNLEILRGTGQERKIKKILDTKGSILMEMMLEQHLTLVTIKKNTDRTVTVTVHNSGDGIDVHHKKLEGKNKYQTSLSLRVKQGQVNKLIKFLDQVDRTPVDDFYKKLKTLGTECKDSQISYQSTQKSGNCGFECYMAAALSILGREEYNAYRLNLMQSIYDAISKRDSEGVEESKGGETESDTKGLAPEGSLEVTATEVSKKAVLSRICEMRSDRTEAILQVLKEKIKKREERSKH